MFKKLSFPSLIAIIISIIALISFILYYNYWDKQDISISNPVISMIKEEEQSKDLKSIIYESEKYVMQIEGQNESDTLTGSGFLYNNQGDIITNAHVIQDAEIIYVRTANARTYPAAVVKISEDTDIAVIRVPQLAGHNNLPVEKENDAEVGDEVIALGSPHGFQNTVTLGIVSGKERNFSVDGFDYKNVYQISAQITHGNSGGPLINRETGKVIGVNSVGTEDGTIGFSIPTQTFIEDVEQWSEETHNDDLEFASTSDIASKLNPDQFIKDGEYIVEYYLDSIKIRDYVNAYAMLGDSMQEKNSYSDFRDKYSNIVNLEYDEIISDLNEDNELISTVNVTLEKKNNNEDKTKKKKKEITFTVGYENDQLKIFKLSETS
ncbi:S1C family serine protease [Virgibacillus sp. MSJ-26]|uniref:S1C family serine protease n=1 Tax=Virgibacillus sp. MSJ-26 TaxID=2841522 RepID=UPI00209EBC63|nr:trypsin-like peptidase domain-containing protein [Virgibacillus sp. MSJ-26]